MWSLYRSICFLFRISFTLINLSLGQTITSTDFDRIKSTCIKNSTQLYSTLGPTSFVLVQPNCDAAISTVCSQAPLGFVDTPYASFTATVRTKDIDPSSDDADDACQVHLVGVGENNLLKLEDYDSCVKGFQNITIDCMLLNYGSYAQKGYQAGVKGVNIQFPAPQSGPDTIVNPNSLKNLHIRSRGLLDPGFLVGPPGYFGDVNLDPDIAAQLKIPAAPFRFNYTRPAAPQR